MLRGSIPERRLKDQNSELAITYASAGRTSTELIEYGVSPGLLTSAQASRRLRRQAVAVPCACIFAWSRD